MAEPSPPMVFAQPIQGSCRPYSASSIDELVDIKNAAEPHMLYPNHGFARGGVGHFVSTGNARGSINRLPQTVRAFHSPLATRSLSAHGSVGSAPHSRPTTVGTTTFSIPPMASNTQEGAAHEAEQQGRSSYQNTSVAAGEPAQGGEGGQRHSLPAYPPPPWSASTGSYQPFDAGMSTMSHRSQRYSTRRPRSTMSSLGGCLQDTLPPPALRSARKPWECEVPHPADFQSATRRTRIHDVPAGSKWSSISFYETDPDEIRRHIDIVNALNEVHANGVVEDLYTQHVKHMTWAQRQRQIFLRQRQERALAYAQSGVPVRPAHVLAAQASAAAAAADEGHGEGSDSHSAIFPSSHQGLHRPRPCTTGSFHTYVPRWGSNSHVLSEDSSTGALAGEEGLGGQSSISLPKPTYRKIFDRMGNETAESPRRAALLWQQKQDAIKASKEALMIASQMRELDEFEGHVRQIQRQQANNTLRGGKRP
ncbi:hypothetical protein DUNSADRAFT_11423 [Dunaliella salina]|uniref:Uncharacterized protein n=1 Tax=Dunaliella salina TaxID=3046 RepID=A0ABQ7GDG0_DUNSA|nr:hypothetical protein DUNSADRAFT_11423 [Dunaliella salina]|eukprot:KAF5832637.1 hypothetical protein DUNSADRAFT_11423 [Dunaliella salina]